MTGNIEELSKYEQKFLKMEDIIERRIEIDKKASAEVDKDWEELYDGECETCGRVYESAYLVGQDYQANSPHDFPPSKGDCIPCWRKKNDLPKIDRDKSEGVTE